VRPVRPVRTGIKRECDKRECDSASIDTAQSSIATESRVAAFSMFNMAMS
jgi:hypothetical protein